MILRAATEKLYKKIQWKDSIDNQNGNVKIPKQPMGKQGNLVNEKQRGKQKTKIKMTDLSLNINNHFKCKWSK